MSRGRISIEDRRKAELERKRRALSLFLAMYRMKRKCRLAWIELDEVIRGSLAGAESVAGVLAGMWQPERVARCGGGGGGQGRGGAVGVDP